MPRTIDHPHNRRLWAVGRVVAQLTCAAWVGDLRDLLSPGAMRKCQSPRRMVRRGVQRWVHCSEDDGVRITADYEVVVDETAGTLQAIAEPCGELRVSTTETSDEVQMTVSLIGGGQRSLPRTER